MSTPLHSKVLIIGSGPAGLTAAIYTARGNLQPLVIEGEPSSTSDQPGGQLMLTTEVENFPGFPEGIMGPELMMRCRDQAIRFGTEFITEKVTKVDFSSRPFRAWVRDTEYTADAVIVSTGAQSLMLGLEEAQFLTKFASKVTIVHRRETLRASKIMQDRAFNNEKISFIWNKQVTRVLGEDKVSGIEMTDTVTGEQSTMNVTGIFVAIGHRPNTDLFKGILQMEDTGYLTTKSGSTYTNIDGVFACGDVQDHIYRQAITAAGSGCMAAIDCERWLEAQHS